MISENLRIDKVVIHEVFLRDGAREIVPPRYGDHLVELGVDAMEALRNRVTSTMNRAARSVEMEIRAAGVPSMLNVARQLLECEGNDFVVASRAAANQLADAQRTRSIPGGILVVFSGTVDYPAKRLIGVIKAEPHDGFTRAHRDGRMFLEFVKDLILTPKARLYKIGVFVEVDSVVAQSNEPARGFRAFVYDDSITRKNPDAAATYFYSAFLGCAFPQSSARMTRHFHEWTKEFIQRLSIPEEDKAGLHTGLHAYVKQDQAAVVQVSEFGESYLPDDEMRDAYEQFMRSKSFPMAAVVKDLSEVAPLLKQRKVRFHSNVRLIVPADQFEQLIDISSMPAEAGAGEAGAIWTRIIVRDRVASSE